MIVPTRKVRRHYIDGEYGQLHLRLAGPDDARHPPLYCLHMSPKSGRSFENFMALASDDRIVVAPDYPGYGESDPPPAVPPITVEDYARSVWQIADTLGHTNIDLLGHHTGSKVATEIAWQRPDSVNAIVMISAAILTAAERAKMNATYSPIPLDEAGTRFRTMWERINFHRGPGMSLEMMATSLAENLRGGENYEWGHHAAFAYGDRYEEILPQLAHPITVLNPADDLVEQTRRVLTLLQNGTLIECPHWGHGFLDAFTREAVDLVKRSLA